MKDKLIYDRHGEKIYALIFDKGDEFMEGIAGFAKKNKLLGSHFTAIGAFSGAVLGYFERDRKDYKRIPVTEQCEVLSLVGDIAAKEGEPSVHAHVVLGMSDGSARGGHVLEAHVWPTLEVIVTESPEHLCKTFDPETGLALINATEQCG